jgi:hypothetical protein
VLLALALIAALAPMLDAAVFGPHDHITPVETATVPVVDSSDGHRVGASHHCELSVSPADSVWYPTVRMPLPLVALLPAGSMATAPHTPVVPTAPPRA